MKVTLIDCTSNPIKTCEECASVCYDSKPSFAILKACVKSGHCYDADTEVLTESGFVKWKDITYDSKLAVVDPKTTNFVGFEKPLALIAYHYEGKLISFDNKYVDLKVTPGHKLYCSLSSTQKNRNNPNFSLIAANEYVECHDKRFNNFVYKKPLRMVTSAINNNSNKGNPLYKLYGFFIGDGYCATDNSKIEFHLTKERKLNFLINICKECGLTLTVRENNKYSIDVYNFRSMFYNKNNEKTFPDYFLKMSKEDFDYFYEGLINSDGSVSDTCVRYDTTSEELKNKISALFALNNTVFTINKTIVNKENCKDIYTITISTKNKYPMFNDSRSKKYALENPYSGMVYCAEVSTGLLIVRRNDKVVLCGNCSVLEHANYTFKIEGVSRALLAQITRHRIASYSVRSQRYCEEDGRADDEPNYVIPPTISKKTYTEYHKAIERSFNEYDYLINEGVPKEDARMVLPNACNTTIMMTINLRSLGNFMGERLCTRAQWEIRECAKLMKREILSTMEDDEAEFFDKYWLAPKCMQHETPLCEEHNCCGRSPSIKQVIEWKNKFNTAEKFDKINIERFRQTCIEEQFHQTCMEQHQRDLFHKEY